MVKRIVGAEDEQVEFVMEYYSTEDQFCSNFISYLVHNPLVEEYKSMLEISEVINYMDGMPQLITKAIVPKSVKNKFKVEKEHPRE